MALLSNPADFDKSIMRRLEYAAETERMKVKPSIMDVCEETGYSYPRTEIELEGFYEFCEIWNIKHNMLPGYWDGALKDARTVIANAKGGNNG